MSVESKARQIVSGYLVSPEVWARVAELAAERTGGQVRVSLVPEADMERLESSAALGAFLGNLAGRLIDGLRHAPPPWYHLGTRDSEGVQRKAPV